jgi:hypothetical protein
MVGGVGGGWKGSERSEVVVVRMMMWMCRSLERLEMEGYWGMLSSLAVELGFEGDVVLMEGSVENTEIEIGEVEWQEESVSSVGGLDPAEAG